ncbi:hypothetical protein GCM10022381_29870 [Leifsonia kafniensis]|uniref:SDR family NAD(P)-dependent oxidoreductase n=1 Tax=Leifsonia kafniensis TaxID=475957 RepID=A0ABP7KRU5_9MICO
MRSVLARKDPIINFRLDGHSALVTGAGRGLGLAIADGLQELGATVYGTSRDAASATTIAERYGTSAVMLNVTDVAAVRRSVDALFESGISIDLLVNNAGVNAPAPALHLEPEQWDSV